MHSPLNASLVVSRDCTQVAREVLLVYHPNAQTWICPQDWGQADYARWVELAAKPSTRAWLDGIIYGPGMPGRLQDFSNATAPVVYPVRLCLARQPRKQTATRALVA